MVENRVKTMEENGQIISEWTLAALATISCIYTEVTEWWIFQQAMAFTFCGSPIFSSAKLRLLGALFLVSPPALTTSACGMSFSMGWVKTIQTL